MALFEGFGRKVNEAAQAAAQKSSELIGITKLNVSMGAEEDKIQKLFIQAGKLVYNDYKSEAPLSEDMRNICTQIAGHEQNITDIKIKILELKRIRICAGCGTELDMSNLFCKNCGLKQEADQEESTPAPSEILCSSCNTPQQSGVSFCTNCGQKLD